MARVDTLGNFLTDVADAIREKKGTSETIQASDFDTEIENLPSGGGVIMPTSITFQNYTGESIDLTNIDTSLVTTMYRMFYACSNIVNLDLSHFNTLNVTNMSQMFQRCSSLLKLDIRNFTFDAVTQSGNMFNSVPTNCLIIVKDEPQKTWMNTNFPTMAKVKTVAEYEAEQSE